MKKGLYLHFDNTGTPSKSGILNKVQGMRTAMHTAGFPSDIINFRTQKELQCNEQRVLRLPSRQLFFRWFIFREILRICRRESYHFIYIRYGGSDRYFLAFLKKIKTSGTKVFIEFPTFPYDGEWSPKNWLERHIIHQDKKFRASLFKHVDFAVSTVLLNTDIFNIPTIRIDNGVDLTKITPAPHTPIPNTIRIIGVANINKWHAWDRVIKGIHLYYQNELREIEIVFRIVGEGPSCEALRQLTEKLDLKDHVLFAGPKTGDDLDKEFENADLAMGTLGLHRIGLASTSVLKLREYTARGLPSVIGYDETVIPTSTAFVHSFPPNDQPLNIEELVSFYTELKVSRQEIRKFAEEHFSWSKVLQAVLEKI